MSDIRKYMKDRKKLSNDAEDEQELERKLRRHKMGKAWKVVILIVVLFIAVYLYVDNYNNKIYTGYDVISSQEVSSTYNTRFYKFGDYMLRYSEDGLAFLNGDQTHWNQSFEMREPVLDICNEYVAIAEQKTNDIYVCNTESMVGKIETEYPIIGIDVSGNGVVAAITEEKSDISHIEVLGKDGTIIAKGQTILSGQGCPVDLSISGDGTKLVVSYLYVGAGTVQSKVVFYNYSEIGKNEVDRFMGGFNFDKTMIARVEFLNNDTVAAFGDDRVVIYSMKQKPSVVAEIEISDKIKSIFYSEEHIGLVLENGQAENPYTLLMYDLEAEKECEFKFNFIYKDIKLNNDTIVMYNDTTLKVYSMEGNKKYEGDFEEGITSVVGTKDKFTYLVVGSSSIKKIKLK